MCRPRLPAACLAPDCPDPPGERIPGVSYFGCSPASRASCSRRSPRGRTSDLGAPREPRVYRCTGSAAGERGQRSALSFCLSVIVRGSSFQPEPLLLGPLTPPALGSLAIWVGRNGPIFSLSTPPHPQGHASPEEKRPRRARHPSRGALLARLSGPPSGLLPF